MYQYIYYIIIFTLSAGVSALRYTVNLLLSGISHCISLDQNRDDDKVCPKDGYRMVSDSLRPILVMG